MPGETPTQPALQRRLGLGDAIVVGAGSMVGAGVFAAWSPAAAAAGTSLIVALAVAAAVAFCNATSSAQLAAIHPESGGTYVYAGRRLGAAWGHLAGWGFVVGKTASCAAIALTIGAYAWPQHARAAGVVAVAVVTSVNLGGLSRTVAVTRVLLVVSFVAIAAVLVSGWSSDAFDIGRITPLTGSAAEVLRAAAYLFFAFAGYARIATLGEEVRDPATVIPKAIPRALGAVLVLYAAVGLTLLATVPIDAIAATGAPMRLVVEASALEPLAGVVRVGVVVASAGVLLNLVPGVSRTLLAMARSGDAPAWFATISRQRQLPVRAEMATAVAVVGVIVVADLRNALGVSGLAVLTYYALTNASALTLPAEQRRWPRPIAMVGLAGCIALVVALPPRVLLTGAAVMLAGVAVRVAVQRHLRPATGGE